jgi:hypothetical protein
MNKKLLCVILIVIILFIIFKNKLFDLGVSTYLKTKMYLHFNSHKYLCRNFFKIHKNIENINYTHFINTKPINANNKSINEYKILDMKYLYENVKNTINHNDVNENLYKILNECLKNVKLNEKDININNCVICDLLYSNVQSYPYFHSDIEWGLFNNSDGFQVWYLFENEDNVGNMFLLDTPHVIQSSFLEFEKNKIKIHSQGDIKYIKDLKDEYSVKYLDMKKGECLIFGQNLYHMSDFRKSKNRYSLNFRVIIKDSDGGISYNSNRKCLYDTNFFLKLKYKNIKFDNKKIYPGMFDLVYVV